MKPWAALVLVTAVVLLVGAGCTRDLTWPSVLADVRAQYPDVTQITTDSLAAWLSDTTRASPVLLDTRAAEEYSISHLPGAIRVDPERPRFDVLELPREAEVVTYCSVGHRSSAVARAMREAGFTNVANLEGSIFKWANEGRPLVGPGGMLTRAVHEYDAAWGELLEENDE